MANYIAAARLRAQLAAYQPAPPPPDAFTDAHWRAEQCAREAADSLQVSRRWRITILPADGCPRDFYLIGLLDYVERRAALIFGPYTSVVAIEPAATRGGEVIDRRLNLSSIP